MGTMIRAVALLLGALLLLPACSADEPEAGPSSSSPSASETPPPPAQVRTGTVTGRVGAKAQERSTRQVGDVVLAWYDAAYGADPRAAEAFPGFTQGARREARRDRMLLSNLDIADRIDGVETRRRDVTVDLLGTRGRPVGATARVRLVFRTSGDLERRVVVTGRLRLVPGPDGWQVFAYDLTKGATA